MAQSGIVGVYPLARPTNLPPGEVLYGHDVVIHFIKHHAPRKPRIVSEDENHVVYRLRQSASVGDLEFFFPTVVRGVLHRLVQVGERLQCPVGYNLSRDPLVHGGHLHHSLIAWTAAGWRVRGAVYVKTVEHMEPHKIPGVDHLHGSGIGAVEAVGELAVLVYDHTCRRCALGVGITVRLSTRLIGRDESRDGFVDREVGSAECAYDTTFLKRILLL